MTDELAGHPSTPDDVREALKQVKDPELDMDIITLGLVYGIDVDNEAHAAKIKMTLTTPFCPYGPALISDVKRAVLKLSDLSNAEVELVWTPKWEPSEELKVQMGLI